MDDDMTIEAAVRANGIGAPKDKDSENLFRFSEPMAKDSREPARLVQDSPNPSHGSTKPDGLTEPQIQGFTPILL